MVRESRTPPEGVDVDGLRDYLAGTEVVFAVLFGSQARDAAKESSDVDIALRFPDDMDAAERFRARNRIDADLQEYADGFVDVSDIDSLPVPVAYAAVREGIVLAGDQEEIDTYRKHVEREYKSGADEREREYREFIDRLARGDT